MSLKFMENINNEKSKKIVWITVLLIIAICVCAIVIFINKTFSSQEKSNVITNQETKKSASYGSFVLTEESVLNNNDKLIVQKDGKELYTIELTVPEENESKYYADWNNANENCLRIRIDNYSENSRIRNGYTWYKFDEEGNLLEKIEYIENSIYKDDKEYGNYKILLTADKYLIVYIPIDSDDVLAGEVVAKFKMYVDESYINNEEKIKKYGYGYYADWNNADEEKLRVRIDNLEKDTYSRNSYTWYIIDKFGDLVNEAEYIDECSFEDQKNMEILKLL